MLAQRRFLGKRKIFMQPRALPCSFHFWDVDMRSSFCIITGSNTAPKIMQEGTVGCSHSWGQDGLPYCRLFTWKKWREIARWLLPCLSYIPKIKRKVLEKARWDSVWKRWRTSNEGLSSTCTASCSPWSQLLFFGRWIMQLFLSALPCL